MTRNGDSRTLQQLREHYEVEKELAGRLRRATREERRSLYTIVYNELYRRVPHHPMLSRTLDARATRESIRAQMRLLKRFLRPDATVVEVGPGDCTLSFEVAKYVRKVYAVDVSAQIAPSGPSPQNFSLILSDGCSIPLVEKTVDLAYSNQVMEHVHPDDAFDQARDIYRVLRPGGIYICVTPNRFSGPHDVSRYFDRFATGFHLKEYTNSELERLFKEVGFSRIVACIGVKGSFAVMGLGLARWCEALLTRCPEALGKRLARAFPLRSILGVCLLAQR